MSVYAITIFLSAFLLFQVQPVIAKMILPWFGGSAAVWSASMLFFQLLLLSGYAYAHISIRLLKVRAQVLLHLGLLLLSCLLLPILPSASWRPTQASDPTLRILMLLVSTIGLPYFLLSSTSPLLQAWFVRRNGSSAPYRLFALSNFGSMLALLSYPLLVEPSLGNRLQALTWSGAYVVFAVACGFTAWVSREAPETGLHQGECPKEHSGERPTPWALVHWVVLAACASVFLVSVTNHMSQNLAPIPLLWVVPLALYLLTFILAFESDRIYRRRFFIPLLVPALGGMAYMLYADDGNFDIKWAIPGFAAGMFVCCMFCHGELARRRPGPRYLTLYYLMVSLGGALGGVFVALIAPRVFHTFLELPLILCMCGTLALIACWEVQIPKAGAWRPRVIVMIGFGLLAGYLGKQERALPEGLRLRVRNFYGTLGVRDDPPKRDLPARMLMHGTINHGTQLLDPVLKYVTTSYYGEGTGVARAMTAVQAIGPIRVGVIGLGAGVLMNFGRKGDYYRVYEINPLVEGIAQTWFSFYPHSPADKTLLMGDGRLTLERQESQNFDMLVVDAFSSDAVPVHLLTREAYKTYLRHLKPDGVMAVNITNRYLDLEPVVAQAMTEIGWSGVKVDDSGNRRPFYFATSWVILARSPQFFESPNFKGSSRILTPRPGFRAWTDDFSNLFEILK